MFLADSLTFEKLVGGRPIPKKPAKLASALGSMRQGRLQYQVGLVAPAVAGFKHAVYSSTGRDNMYRNFTRACDRIEGALKTMDASGVIEATPRRMAQATLKELRVGVRETGAGLAKVVGEGGSLEKNWENAEQRMQVLQRLLKNVMDQSDRVNAPAQGPADSQEKKSMGDRSVYGT